MASLATRASRWDALRDQQKASVAEAIIRLVSEGTSAVTVAEIADLAGISRPTFYKYFPTLGTAMLHTHRVVLLRIGDYVSTRMPTGGNARERLLAFVELRFAYTTAHPELMRFFSYFDFTFRQFGLTTDERRELDEISFGSGDATRELFLAGQADGSIDSELPADATIMAFAGSFVGLAQRLLIQDEYSTGVDERARQAHEILVVSWRTTLGGRALH
jgi:AcrR family transcriptional regulator